MIYYLLKLRRFFARGIVAEPPKHEPQSGEGEGDGADSPTRGSEATEAARPNHYYYWFGLRQNLNNQN